MAAIGDVGEAVESQMADIPNGWKSSNGLARAKIPTSVGGRMLKVSARKS